ncbi:MAG TPA: hypothetical protein VGF23_18720 [Gaiellaceae bacterium]|jgi:hypothetical protein
MGAVKRAWLLLAALTAPSAAAAAPPLQVRATFDTPTVQFGAPVTARVVVLADRTQVRPASISILGSVAPLTVLSQRTNRSTQGGSAVVATVREVACSSEACLAAGGDATPKLTSVTVRAVGADGHAIRAVAAWPVLHVRDRVSAVDRARAQPPFRADTSPPAATLRISASTLAWLLDAAAVALAIAAIAVAAHLATSLARRRRRATPVGELARALRLAHEAEGRPAPDRRRALGLLARVLSSRDRRLAESANDLAWSSRSPDRDELGRLVVDVEREVPS